VYNYQGTTWSSVEKKNVFQHILALRPWHAASRAATSVHLMPVPTSWSLVRCSLAHISLGIGTWHPHRVTDQGWCPFGKWCELVKLTTSKWWNYM
jgi:hypothetical protein